MECFYCGEPIRKSSSTQNGWIHKENTHLLPYLWCDSNYTVRHLDLNKQQATPKPKSLGQL